MEERPEFQLPNGDPDTQKIDQAKFLWLEYYKIKFNGTWYTRIVDKLKPEGFKIIPCILLASEKNLKSANKFSDYQKILAILET